MNGKFTLDNFYISKEWRTFREVVIQQRTNRQDGYVYDEYTGNPILKPYDIILHHKTHLTNENVNDVNISLNPDNIMIVSIKTHNAIHNKLGRQERNVYVVWGSPLSGKSTWVKDNMHVGDLVVDMDSIWQCVSGCERYIKPNRLKSIVFSIRNELIDTVRMRRGKWNNAYIIGGYPFSAERERLIRQLNAKDIHINTTKEECLLRLQHCDDARDKNEWRKYINDWWMKYKGTPT